MPFNFIAFLHSFDALNYKMKKLPFLYLVTFIIGFPILSFASIDIKAVFNNSFIWSSSRSIGKLITYNSKSFLLMSDSDIGISSIFSKEIMLSSNPGLPKYLHGLLESGK